MSFAKFMSWGLGVARSCSAGPHMIFGAPFFFSQGASCRWGPMGAGEVHVLPGYLMVLIAAASKSWTWQIALPASMGEARAEPSVIACGKPRRSPPMWYVGAPLPSTTTLGRRHGTGGFEVTPRDRKDHLTGLLPHGSTEHGAP